MFRPTSLFLLNLFQNIYQISEIIMQNKKPKIALIGYGAMGKEIQKIAIDNKYFITDIFEIDKKISVSKQYEFDVAIDFSFPESVRENIEILSNLKKNIVIGTTGWYNQIDDIKKIVELNNIGCIYSSNFSIGIQIFQRIIELSSKLTNKITGYDIFINELHHKRKKDSPSGTALTLANIILKNFKSKKEIFTDKCNNKISPEQLHVSSVRGGELPGTHTVYLDSFSDTIELTHRAKNRTAFAEGALSAAQWIFNNKGFFTFEQMLNEIWKDIDA